MIEAGAAYRRKQTPKEDEQEVMTEKEQGKEDLGNTEEGETEEGGE